MDIKAQIMPRDIIDWVVMCTVGVIQVFILLVFPALVAGVIFQSFIVGGKGSWKRVSPHIASL